MFLTALAPNLLAVEIGRTVANVGIPGGMSAALGFLPVGSCCSPLLSYFFIRRRSSGGDEVARWAGAELITMGRITRPEATMGILGVAALVG